MIVSVTPLIYPNQLMVTILAESMLAVAPKRSTIRNVIESRRQESNLLTPERWDDRESILKLVKEKSPNYPSLECLKSLGNHYFSTSYELQIPSDEDDSAPSQIMRSRST